MMDTGSERSWRKRLVQPEKVLKQIKPGMSIFVSTGVAEPRGFIRSLMAADGPNLQDLELIQLFSFGDAVSPKNARSQKYRLKTFFSGWIASDEITEGRVDLIPSRFSKIPDLIQSRQVSIDAVVVQVSPPNPAGYCSLGVAVDVAREAMEKASLIVGEINEKVPITYGDTFVHPSDFHLLMESTDPPIYFQRWPADEVYDKVAANVASVVEDRSCIGFSVGPLYDALARHLARKRHLGVHSPFVTDALMDLIRSGAVTNRHKENWRGKSVVSYAIGTPELLSWLDRNPLVEFQGVDKVFDPQQIGRNRRYMAIMPARKVDLSGRIALHFGKSVAAEPGEIMDFFAGAMLSDGGIRIFALPSRNRTGQANIRVSIEDFPNQFSLRESVDMIVTEYGVAVLKGRTLRERALALIDVAHPEDRPGLILEAKEKRALYQDQIYLSECGHAYPSSIGARETFKNGLEVRFRAIKPSDENEMRRLFYRFSDQSVYFRYFTPVKTMPHAKMQEYVNVDCNRILSIVGLIGDPSGERIIAEARFGKYPDRPYADIAFFVDDQYQGYGIATYLYRMLVREGRKRGLKGFTADVLASNKAMMKVFEKGDLPFHAKMGQGVFELTIPFEPTDESWRQDV
jgi:acyl-CoA hydrolase/GNAT superfamily N-acetyltransferase